MACCPFIPAVLANLQKFRKEPISFSVNYDTWWEGIARIVDQEKEPKLVAEVSNLMGRKYGWNEGLIVELIHH